jgi:hypothetical protein
MMSYAYSSPYYAGNDSACWMALTPGNYSETFPLGDNVFFFGSGYFSLAPGESQPMSIAIMVGADSADVWQNAHSAQAIYERQPGSPTHVIDTHEPPAIPDRYWLGQNYPNPFNGSTKIPLRLPPQDLDRVRLSIYNVLGQVVRHLPTDCPDGGRRFVLWDGRDDAGRAVESGLYLCHLEVGNWHQIRKMVLIR